MRNIREFVFETRFILYQLPKEKYLIAAYGLWAYTCNSAFKSQVMVDYSEIIICFDSTGSFELLGGQEEANVASGFINSSRFESYPSTLLMSTEAEISF